MTPGTGDRLDARAGKRTGERPGGAAERDIEPPQDRRPDEPDAGPDNRDAEAEDPDAGAEDPDAGAEDPDAGPEDPDAGPDEPDGEPDEPVAEADVAAAEPEAVGGEPEDAARGEPEDAAADDPAGGGARSRRVPIPQAVLALVTGALLVFAAGYAVGQQRPGGAEGGSAGRAAAPADDSAAAGFARDMQIHHAQAVQMSMIVRDRTDDARIRTLAYDIALTQQHQIGQMYGWLSQWGLPQVSGRPPLAWARGMDHGPAGGGDGSSGAAMPGMATATQLRDLERSEGREAEIRFLDLMIPHHEAGVRMAQTVLADTDNPQVRLLAGTMVRGQREEIELMRQLRRDRA
jgi:uncharacterized protein (DUF305 family)